MSIGKGPKGSLIFGSAFDFSKDPIGFIRQTTEEYSDIASFRFVHKPVHLISDPDLIKQVFQNKEGIFHRGKQFHQLKYLLGKGLALAEGDTWKQQRRVLQPTFSKNSVPSFFSTMSACTDEALAEWKTTQTGTLHPFNISQELGKITHKIAGKTIISMDLRQEANEISDLFYELVEMVTDRVKATVNPPLWVPFARHLRFKTKKRRLNDFIDNMIRERRQTAPTHEDMLSMLMVSMDKETDHKMTDEILRDEIITLFVAGHESTSIALSWIVYLLCKNPLAEKKLIQELDQAVSKEGFTLDDIPQLNYLSQVIDESLRLFPPFWLLSRTTRRTTTLGNRKIGKGDTLLICPYAMHRTKRYWENPEAFDPERFDPENKARINKYVYFPFGQGSRICLGNHFSTLEMKVILTKLYLNFKISLPKDFEAKPTPLLTIEPGNGVMVRLTPR